MFDKTNYEYQPNYEDLNQYIHNSLWQKFNHYMFESYQAKPVFEFSKCSFEYGWNVKFKKGSRTICTTYPRENYFIILLVIGKKQKENFENLLPSLTHDIQDLYNETQEGNGQKWLMIELEDDNQRYEDVKKIIKIRNQ
ncbi:MAG: DUF3788 domain-containing protein [Coprobacillus sp.]|nr:DUF3788 domain-containing protein [Coprobacillus sp.]